MLLLVYALILAAATAPPASSAAPPPGEIIQYSWTKSGFTILRKELTISENGDYTFAYNGREGCASKGTLPATINAELWKEAHALMTVQPFSAKPRPGTPPRRRHASRRTSMDNGTPTEIVLIANRVNSSIVFDQDTARSRHFTNELRQLLPPCAF